MKSLVLLGRKSIQTSMTANIDTWLTIQRHVCKELTISLELLLNRSFH